MIIYFGISGDKYHTLVSLEYEGLKIQAGFEFDGVTVKAPFPFLFSNKALRQVIRESCLPCWH